MTPADVLNFIVSFGLLGVLVKVYPIINEFLAITNYLV